LVNKEFRKKKVDFNYNPFTLTPRNIKNQARKTNPIPIIPQVSVELKVPKANVGRIPPAIAKKISINTNSPIAKSKKLKITVNFVGGVHAIDLIQYQYFIVDYY
jgi:hypothetical protein